MRSCCNLNGGSRRGASASVSAERTGETGEDGMAGVDDVLGLIHRDELVRFALELCNIDSAIEHEGSVGEHIYAWMRAQGFTTRKLGLQADRFNVLGTLPGSGGGHSPIFHSHMDNAVPREP